MPGNLTSLQWFIRFISHHPSTLPQPSLFVAEKLNAIVCNLYIILVLPCLLAIGVLTPATSFLRERNKDGWGWIILFTWTWLPFFLIPAPGSRLHISLPNVDLPFLVLLGLSRCFQCSESITIIVVNNPSPIVCRQHPSTRAIGLSQLVFSSCSLWLSP